MSDSSMKEARLQEWGGGTLVDGELIRYVGNRLVIFDAHLPHMAMPVSRECYELRTNVVFKCNIDSKEVDNV